MDIPSDPIILVSYVNTKLRDQFPTIDEFCNTYEVNLDELKDKLATVDYHYDDTTNQFV